VRVCDGSDVCASVAVARQVVEGRWRGERVAVKLLEEHAWAGLLQAPQPPPEQLGPSPRAAAELRQPAAPGADGAAAADQRDGSASSDAGDAAQWAVGVGGDRDASQAQEAVAGASSGERAAAQVRLLGSSRLSPAGGGERDPAWLSAFRAELEVGEGMHG
jgi:hypothetical protein